MDGSRWSAPLFGGTNAIVTDRLQLALPMTPNTRHTLRWAREWSNTHGRRTVAEVRYGGIDARIELALEPSGLAFNAGRY